MAVREATAEDAEAVCRVHESSIRGLGPEGYRDEVVEAWAGDRDASDYDLERPDLTFVVAEREGQIVGFGSLKHDAPDEYAAEADAEVTAVYVHPDAAGDGVGSRILGDLEERARDHGYDSLLLSSSMNAVSFYGERGYDRVRETPHEFPGGVEAPVVEMKKRL